jgi:hypothetical protein
MKTDQGDSRSADETEQRLGRLLQGAFSGPPTPLKRIPKKNGKSRAKPRESSAASAETAGRRP